MTEALLRQQSNSKHFIKDGSLSFSEQPTTGSYPQPYGFNQHCPILLLDAILIRSFLPHTGVPSGIHQCGFPIKTLYAFLYFPMHATCPSLLCYFQIHNISGEYKQ